MTIKFTLSDENKQKYTKMSMCKRKMQKYFQRKPKGVRRLSEKFYFYISIPFVSLYFPKFWSFTNVLKSANILERTKMSVFKNDNILFEKCINHIYFHFIHFIHLQCSDRNMCNMIKASHAAGPSGTDHLTNEIGDLINCTFFYYLRQKNKPHLVQSTKSKQEQ